MSPILRSLLWKEFREHIYKMLTLLAILLTAVIWTESPFVPRLLRDSWQPIWICASFLAPIWLAATTITSEKTRRTAITLSSLPVSPTKVFLIKTVIAVLTIILPLTLSLLCGLPSINGWDRVRFFSLIFTAITLYPLILCIGMGIRREGMAALVGVLILLVSGMWVAVISVLGDHPGTTPLALEWLILADPFAFTWAVDGGNTLDVPAFIAQFVATAVYWMLSAYRYTHHSAASRVAEKMPATAQQLPIPPLTLRRNPLLWKERREQLSILILTALVGLALAILFGLILEHQTRPRPYSQLTTFTDILQVFFLMGTFVPTLVTAIIGISTISTDLDDPLAAFWQSRPIRATSLFWTKYIFALTGLFALVLFFEIPYLAVVRLQPILSNQSTISLNGDTDRTHMAIGQLFWLPLALAIALLSAAIFRRTIYAAIAMIIAVLALLLIPLGYEDTFATILFTGSPAAAFPPVTTITLISAALLTLLARTAFSKHWRIG